MKLADNANLLWRRWSTRIAASQAGLVLFWAGLPEKWQDAIPAWILATCAGIFAIAFISAQAVKQPSLAPKSEEPPKAGI